MRGGSEGNKSSGKVNESEIERKPETTEQAFNTFVTFVWKIFPVGNLTIWLAIDREVLKIGPLRTIDAVGARRGQLRCDRVQLISECDSFSYFHNNIASHARSQTFNGNR